MADSAVKKKRVANARIRALKAAKKLPTAILIQKKVECDAKALKIVERLIEPQVAEEWLLQSLTEINRSHLEDVIEERAIMRLCGYALCDNPLTKVVSKKYEISTLRNKVYDVQKTKNFCSFWCYSASEYLLEQMLTSPLWLRAEEEIPAFTTFKKPREKMKNPPGVEINIVGIELPVDVDPVEENAKEVDENSKKSNKSNTSEKRLLDDTNISGKKVRFHDGKEQVPEVKPQKSEVNNEDNKSETVEVSGEASSMAIEQKIDKIDENSEKIVENSQTLAENVQKIDEDLQKMDITASETPKDTKTEEKEQHPSSEQKPTNSATVVAQESPSTASKKSEFTKNTEKLKKRKQRPPVSFESLTARVEQSMTEWITKTTIDLIHGDDIVKQRILDNVNIHEKYAVLCKKLSSIQLEEEKEERVNAIQSTKLKPLPHFSVLKEEAEALELKVKAYFKGDTTIPIPDPQEKKQDDNSEEKNDETFVPLTEAHAPMAVRRRIFLDKLNKVLPDLLKTLSGPGQFHHTYTPDKIAKIKALVGTFHLTAANIVFKSAEWTLVALLIIKLLSLMDDNVNSLLVTKQATTYTGMILMSYQLDCNYLDRLVSSLIVV